MVCTQFHHQLIHPPSMSLITRSSELAGLLQLKCTQPHTFYAWNIVIPTHTSSLASGLAATLYQVHHSCRGWRIQTFCRSVRMSGSVKLPATIDRRREARMAFPSLSPNHWYALLVTQSLWEDSPRQLRGWSTRTTESRSLWCIVWTCIVGRPIVQTVRFLLAIGQYGLKITKH